MSNETVFRDGIIVLGGASYPVTQVSSAYVVTLDDVYVIATSGSFNITLNNASLQQGKTYIFKNSSSNSQSVTVVAKVGETIDGQASKSLNPG